jgi:ABC-type multidrug transport system ATPase subunit
LSFGFEAAKPLLTGLSFDIPASGVTLIQGGESRGKSTLLRLLAGLLRPSCGSLRMHGLDLHEPALAASIYAHDPRLPDWSNLSPRLYFAQMARHYPGFDDAVVTDMLDHLELAEHADKDMYMLSTGSKRKVSWVAALACGADLLLMDEPFAALDLASIRKLHQLLSNWHLTQRSAWVLADYQAPGTVPLSALIDLGN